MLYRILRGIFALFAGLVFCLPSAGAVYLWAEPRVYYCNLSGDSVDFGTVADTELYSKTLTANIKADCERPFITGITGIRLNYGAYCLAIKGNTAGSAFEGTRYLASANNPNDKIYFSFYDVKNPNLPIGEDFSGKYGYLSGSPNINLAANFWGSFNMIFPVNVRLFRGSAGGTGNSIAAGLYSGAFNAEMYYGALAWPSSQWSANSAADCTGLSGVWPFSAWKSPVYGPITVKATIKSSCSIDSVDSINFGKIPSFQLGQGFSARGAVKAHCSKGASYQIGLGAGLHENKAGGGYRAMQRQGSDDFIAYDLYQDSSRNTKWTNAWGTGNTITVKNGSGNSEAHDVYAYIPPQETGKKTGIYQDTVVVEIRLNAQ